MILSAVFLAFLTFIVVMGLAMIVKANLEEKERRDSVLLIAVLFITVLTLNEIQNIHLSSLNTSHYQHSSFQDAFAITPPLEVLRCIRVRG
jgi:DMSO reductase anchor subunit